MSCQLGETLMVTALDGEQPPELPEHLEQCDECAAEWPRLVALEHWLRVPAEPQLPRRFLARTMARLELSLNAPWLSLPTGRALLAVVTTLTGALWVMVGLAVARQALGHPAAVATWLDIAEPLTGFGLAEVTRNVVAPASGALTWLVYTVLVASLALLWFGALLLPRLAPQGAGRRQQFYWRESP